MRVPLASLLLLASVACTPAHRPADGDGGIGPDSGRPTICGDSFVNIDVDEQCDDGNTDDGDGCDSKCKAEIPENCGNNVIDEGEDCDDNNNEAGDGCGPGCWIEGCGNHFIDPGEACEDGNTVDGDGCSADCRSNETCGNGIQDPGEGCDDGDGDNGDLCPASCQPAVCGDNFVHLGVEGCDDGNDVADDGCTDCILDSCGDSIPDPGEECDLGAGNGLNGTTCFKNCLSTELEAGGVSTVDLDPLDAIGSGPNYVEAADFNGDNKADIIIGDRIAGVTAIAYGLGDGRIWPAIHYFGNSGSLRNMTVRDVNNDSIPDAIGVTSADTVLVMLGTGTGFAAPTSFTTILDIGGDDPFDVVVAELTGDSNLDIATANTTSNDVVILAGDGTGSFTATTRLAVSVGDNGVAPRSLAVGDVTGDGKIDVVTANLSSDDVTLFAGLGNGAYAAGQIFTTRVGAGGDDPSDIVITDVTNDGVADVIVGCVTSDDVVVLASNGGGLAAPQRFSTLSGGGGDGPTRIFVGDVTQDGIKDIVSANANSGDVAIMRGLGPGVAFGPATILSVAIPEVVGAPTTRDVRAADINGDNILDIVTVNSGTRDATVFLGQGGGSFGSPRAFRTTTDFDSSGATVLVLADINGDSRLDAVTANASSVTTLANLGGGLLAGSQITSGYAGQSVGVGDLNGDGRLDYAEPRSAAVTTFVQTPNGQFSNIGFNSLVQTPTHVDIGEFTGDSNLDVVAISSSSMFFFSNTGTGTLTAGQSSSTSGTVQSCVLGDVTGDMELDIVMASPNSNGVFIGTGTGTGTFSAPVVVTSSAGSSGQQPLFTVVADLDGDGLNDMVTANRSSNDLSVLLGEGSGTFAPPQIVPTVFGAEAASVESVGSGDFNNDGVADLAAVNADRGSVSLMLGFGNGLFAAPQTYEVPGRPVSISIADFDGDGVDDVVIVDSEGGTITTLTGFAHP